MIQHILNQPSAKLFSMVQGTPALYNPFRRLSVTIKKTGTTLSPVPVFLIFGLFLPSQ